MNDATTPWVAGAAEVDVTPVGPVYLAGYPGVARESVGVHDPLLASALYLRHGGVEALFVACDVLNIPSQLATRARQRIEQRIGLPAGHVMVTATHTHSGPITVRMITNDADPHVPRPDPAYLTRLEDGIVDAAVAAQQRGRPARLFAADADGSPLGTNRRDPDGPRIANVPVLLARDTASGRPIAVMAVCTMHPTVLHEDWLQVSGDFPGLARQWLKRHAVGDDCPFVYHMGAAGNQSPRHVVRANTIDEAHRLGEALGKAIEQALGEARPLAGGPLRCAQRRVDLPVRPILDLAAAQQRVEEAERAWRRLQTDGAPRARVRTAECDWFGAKKSAALAAAAKAGLVDEAVRARTPAPVQVIAVADRAFVGWPGEVFVEFALEVMRDHPNATIVTLAGGELHGYLVTQQAADEGGYEASHGLFESPSAGDRLTEATRALLDELR